MGFKVLQTVRSSRQRSTALLSIILTACYCITVANRGEIDRFPDFSKGFAMSDEFCRCPPTTGSETGLRRMISARRIAIVGLSDDPSRPSFDVAGYLLGWQGNCPGQPELPHGDGPDMLSQSLEAVPGKIDLVNVFRRPEFCPDVARSAVAVGAGALAAKRVVSDEAEAIARQGRARFRAGPLH